MSFHAPKLCTEISCLFALNTEKMSRKHEIQYSKPVNHLHPWPINFPKLLFNQVIVEYFVLVKFVHCFIIHVASVKLNNVVHGYKRWNIYYHQQNFTSGRYIGLFTRCYRNFYGLDGTNLCLGGRKKYFRRIRNGF